MTKNKWFTWPVGLRLTFGRDCCPWTFKRKVWTIRHAVQELAWVGSADWAVLTRPFGKKWIAAFRREGSVWLRVDRSPQVAVAKVIGSESGESAGD